MPEGLSHDRKSSQAVVNTGQEVIHTHTAVRSSGQVSSQHCQVLVMDREQMSGSWTSLKMTSISIMMKTDWIG